MIKKQDLRVLVEAERDFNMVVAVQAITRLRLCRRFALSARQSPASRSVREGVLTAFDLA